MFGCLGSYAPGAVLVDLHLNLQISVEILDKSLL